MGKPEKKVFLKTRRKTVPIVLQRPRMSKAADTVGITRLPDSAEPNGVSSHLGFSPHSGGNQAKIHAITRSVAQAGPYRGSTEGKRGPSLPGSQLVDFPKRLQDAVEIPGCLT